MAKHLKVASTKPMCCLSRLPEWWMGAAKMRLEFAREALNANLDKEADEHMRIAAEYERKAAELGQRPSVLSFAEPHALRVA